MTQEIWTTVDNYVSEMLVPPDKALDQALEASADSGLPEIAVAPNQGKFLMLLARSIKARNILEIGTLGGYSTIWLARALPKAGRVVTLEAVARHAEVARANFKRAGLADVIDLRLGKALDTLPRLAADGRQIQRRVTATCKPERQQYRQRAGGNRARMGPLQYRQLRSVGHRPDCVHTHEG